MYTSFADVVPVPAHEYSETLAIPLSLAEWILALPYDTPPAIIRERLNYYWFTEAKN